MLMRKGFAERERERERKRNANEKGGLRREIEK